MNTLYTLLQEQNLWVLTAFFVIPFVATLIIVPWLVIRLPADYFHQETRHPYLSSLKHPVFRIMILLVKNLLGLVILLMGIAMLFLPGQGLLTMLIGILMLDFPGKFRCERWFVSRRPVLRSINWLRRKSGKPRLRVDK